MSCSTARTSRTSSTVWSSCRCSVTLAVLLLVQIGCASPAPETDPYTDTIEEWRTNRHERLESEGGWLTLVGLHWLDEGENRFGAAPDNDIVFPEGRSPAHVGTFMVELDRVTVRAEADSGLTVGGVPVEVEQVIQADDSGEPDILSAGGLSFHVIRRNERFAVRVKDPASPVLAAFTAMEYFPIDPAYRISAEFVPYDEPREIVVPNVLGYSEPMSAPGEAVFSLDGQSLSLVPVLSSPDAEQLFFIFSDGTSGKETYGAGRFLYTPLPENGRVDLDFNKAYNPPCVFTPYATCPLPPPGNRLAVRIEAGEKDFGYHEPPR